MSQDLNQNPEENPATEETTPDHIPEIAKKSAKFGPGQFQMGSKFGK